MIVVEFYDNNGRYLIFLDHVMSVRKEAKAIVISYTGPRQETFNFDDARDCADVYEKITNLIRRFPGSVNNIQ